MITVEHMWGGTGFAVFVIAVVLLSAVDGLSGANWTMITLNTQQFASPIPANNNQWRNLLLGGFEIVLGSCMAVIFLLKIFLNVDIFSL